MQEIYFNLKGEDKIFDLDEPFNHGNSAESFFHDGTMSVFKRYIQDENKPISWRIDYNVFDFLKSCDKSNLIKLQETFYLKKTIRIFDKLRTINRPQTRIIDAYTYDYISEVKARLIDMPVEYFVEGINGFEQLAEYFAKNKLLMDDLIIDNIIINKDGMVLMDPDTFKFYYRLDEETILMLNRKNLYALFNGIMIQERTADEIGMERLFADVDYKKDMAGQVSKKLTLCKNTKDFVRKK